MLWEAKVPETVESIENLFSWMPTHCRRRSQWYATPAACTTTCPCSLRIFLLQPGHPALFHGHDERVFCISRGFPFAPCSQHPNVSHMRARYPDSRVFPLPQELNLTLSYSVRAPFRHKEKQRVLAQQTLRRSLRCSETDSPHRQKKTAITAHRCARDVTPLSYCATPDQSQLMWLADSRQTFDGRAVLTMENTRPPRSLWVWVVECRC